jgi:predicted RecA/RadA family phage recombinase
MADISRDQYLKFWDGKNNGKWVLDNSAAQTAYIGSPMILDVSEDTVYPRIFDSNVTLASGDVFIGFADEGKVVATTDTETDNVIDIIEYPSIVGLPAGSLTDASVGKPVYMSDSGTLTVTAGSNLKIGKIFRVRESYVFIVLEDRTIQSHA